MRGNEHGKRRDGAGIFAIQRAGLFECLAHKPGNIPGPDFDQLQKGPQVLFGGHGLHLGREPLVPLVAVLERAHAHPGRLGDLGELERALEGLPGQHRDRRADAVDVLALEVGEGRRDIAENADRGVAGRVVEGQVEAVGGYEVRRFLELLFRRNQNLPPNTVHMPSILPSSNLAR